MFRYIAYTWNIENAEQADAARLLGARLQAQVRRWKSAFDGPGFKVFYSNAQPRFGETYPLGNQQGTILGTLFERNSDPLCESVPQRAAFTVTQAARVIATGGRSLIESHWGWYVAFLRDASSGRRWIMRGPMSDLPCLRTTYRGMHIFFSRVEDCIDLEILHFTIDWDFVALQVGFGNSSRIGESAIKEVEALERGECIELRARDVAKHIYWHPGHFATSDPIDDPPTAVRLLQNTTRRCVHAWASTHQSILLRFSGGFDSSVVFGCLRSAPNRPHITALNYYWPGSKGDEREYARAVGQATAIEVIEREFGCDVHLNVVEHVARTAAPIHDVIDWQEHAREQRLGRDHQVTAVFTGSQGDSLFQKTALTYPAADFLQLRGLRPGLLTAARNVAWHQRVSMWHVLSRALQDGLFKRPKGDWNIYKVQLNEAILPLTSLLTCDEVMETVRQNMHRLTHPWLKSADGIPIGKLWLIASLATEGFYDAHFRGPDDPPIIAPFISQPLTELCLRIPSYLNVLDGWDRALARRAFSDDLPTAILNRSTKGSPDPWLKVMIERNAEFVREFLFDGVLVRNKILDSRKLKLALPGNVSKSAVSGSTIMNILYTEAWLRSWSRVRTRVAA